MMTPDAQTHPTPASVPWAITVADRGYRAELPAGPDVLFGETLPTFESIQAFDLMVCIRLMQLPPHGDAWAHMRRTCGISVWGAAEDLGVDRETIGIWERSPTVPRAAWDAMCEWVREEVGGGMKRVHSPRFRRAFAIS